MSGDHFLGLRGVRENNLKNLDINIKHGTFTAFAGVSGSGKSSLAFDTIYAEGGRRYIETFSPYTRQFLDRLHRPQVDRLEGVRPALALEQRRSSGSARSTVGTATEINDYLKLVWSQLAVIVCPQCRTEIENNTSSSLAKKLLGRLEQNPEVHFVLGFRLGHGAEASSVSLRETLLSMGFSRYFDFASNTIRKLEQFDLEAINTANGSKLDLFIVVDRISLGKSGSASKREALHRRIVSSVTECFRYAHGVLSVLTIDGHAMAEESFHQGYVCVGCDAAYPLAKPGMFSFNSPLGACPVCHGFGNVLSIDENLVVNNRDLTLNEGAISCWTGKAASWERKILKRFCRKNDIDLDTPWKKLPKHAQRMILDGDPDGDYFGVHGWFKWLETKRYKMHVRVFLSYYRSERLCSECSGNRLRAGALIYRLKGITLPNLWQMPASQALEFFSQLVKEHSIADVVYPSLLEVEARLSYLVRVGLPYLTLDRQMKTLSGGEAQRVNFTSLLGSRLCHTTIVLDEPTVGLHPSDTRLLVDVIKSLRDHGNTVLVVEHDRDILREADEIIELGPKAGEHGGEIVFQGSPDKLMLSESSLTARYLRDPLAVTEADKDTGGSVSRFFQRKGELIISGASLYNLKNLTVRIPLGGLVAITGISGSGKSTLVEECVFEVYSRLQRGEKMSDIAKGANAPISALEGLENLDQIVMIDQTPLGKNPRANAATYTGAWDIIRQALAETADARKLGLSASHFSFNVDGGRCPLCKGAGALRVEMQFLSDVFVECEACGGTRFQDQILTVRLGGKNVHELLGTSLAEVLKLLEGVIEESQLRTLAHRVEPMIKLGLGYLTLGQPLSELSGGEAQRVKLAAYLGSGNKKSESGKCLFILDEPTTGMHPHNVRDLLFALRELIASGHSLLVIEHNLDLIAAADWMIDLGPEGGEKGGQIIAQGRVMDLLDDKVKVATSKTLQALRDYFAVSRSGRKGALSSRERREDYRASHFLPTVLPTLEKSEEKYNLADDSIYIVGARHHNLTNINVSVPKNLITCITGVSGSGKSTLAFDILFSEGQRRYIDCLSPYARQYIKQLERPDVDQVFGIPPTVAVSQKTAPPSGISTIATTTELYQYLRLLYAKVGTQYCPRHHLPLASSSAAEIAEQIMAKAAGGRIFILAPVVAGRKGNYQALFRRALEAEIHQAIVDGKVTTITDELRLERHKLHWVSLVVAALKGTESNRSLLVQAVEQSLLLSGADVEVAVGSLASNRQVFSTARVCPVCQTGFRELDPQDFSFRSARGVCAACEGRGYRGESHMPCASCGGARIGEIGRNVLIEGYGIAELTKLTAPQLQKVLLSFNFPERLRPVTEPIYSEIIRRLEIIGEVGLSYLSLNRDSDTLSGGEAQRLRLARTLGSVLTGVCYVFDEPTIGLHPKDHGQVMNILRRLRDEGNTVIVVEHDPETILASDYVIDVGPGGGFEGGRIVAESTPEELLNNAQSATGRALKERQKSARQDTPVVAIPKRKLDYLTIEGATANNLRDLTVEFALGAFNVVCGVSGSGKSSLIHSTLVPALQSAMSGGKRSKSDTWKSIKGTETLNKIIEIDQSPPGRTVSSIPLSYLGIFDELRKVYATIPEAKVRGWNAGYFSFNSGGGRCAECGGKGFVKVPMNFLPDAVACCEACGGLRYHDQVSEVTYQSLSIGDLLKKTISQAKHIMSAHARIYRMLDFVEQLGLGYLTLGQPTFTLSGGEAQRIKIARELGGQTGAGHLYILDEPTVGLHMVDVSKLILMLRELVNRGNTVIVIEHDLEVIGEADHLIELGPEAGQRGGKLLYSGSPRRLLARKTPTSLSLSATHP